MFSESGSYHKQTLMGLSHVRIDNLIQGDGLATPASRAYAGGIVGLTTTVRFARRSPDPEPNSSWI